MTADSTRVPVLVGAGQLTNREQDPVVAPDPFAMMEAVSRDAAAEAGEGLLRELTHVWTVHSMSVRHSEPARLLAARLGADAAETRCSGMGGSVPQWLVDRACELVVSGVRPRVLITGVEALATRKRAKRAGIELKWPSEPGWPETWPPIEPDLAVHEIERRHSLDQATAMYALVETALCHSLGETPHTHSRTMGELMSGFNAVAADNPYSWFPTRRDAKELTSVSEENRIIYYPYPKYLNAVMDVDMAAALILTDAQTAREWGLARDEVAYVRGWADAHEIWYLSQRPRVDRADALALCARVALEMAGIVQEELSAFDLYSCFPSSIEVASGALGIPGDDRRPLTLTGGLPYHGGPGSNYVTHSIANTFEWLRAGNGDHVLVHGNGYYLTKHAVGVYSRIAPAETPMCRVDTQQIADAEAEPIVLDASTEGTGTVVAYTALFTREGDPQPASVLVETAGHRSVARADPALTAALVTEDCVGAKVSLSTGEEGNLARSP